ncbi:MAG TPA: hypothetical protein VMT94_06015 [Burkholderiales bacterium]|nr:hypothetical protein [Burkholderiales bacterium]
MKTSMREILSMPGSAHGLMSSVPGTDRQYIGKPRQNLNPKKALCCVRDGLKNKNQARGRPAAGARLCAALTRRRAAT